MYILCLIHLLFILFKLHLIINTSKLRGVYAILGEGAASIVDPKAQNRSSFFI